jgi:hypothetical protein
MASATLVVVAEGQIDLLVREASLIQKADCAIHPLDGSYLIQRSIPVQITKNFSWCEKFLTTPTALIYPRHLPEGISQKLIRLRWRQVGVGVGTVSAKPDRLPGFFGPFPPPLWIRAYPDFYSIVSRW